MRCWKDESGQMVALLAICMSTLLAFMGLAVDVGLLFRAQRQVQTAADAAATAAALDYKYNPTAGTWSTAGLAAASSNGLTDTSLGGDATVTISPPTTGLYGSTNGAVFLQAVVSERNPTYFMGLLSFGKITVAAKAVAAIEATNGCVWTLGRTGTDINNTGSGSLSVPKCEIYDDSSNASGALDQTGSGSITAARIGIVGGYTNTGSGTISPKPITGMTTVSDPLSSLQAPSIPTSTGSSCQPDPNYSGSGNHSLSPGCYNGITITGSGTLTLAAGNYVINGNGIRLSGSPTVTLGTGNYIINGDLTNTGSGTLTLGNGNFTISGNMGSTGSGALNLGSGLYIVEGNLQLTGSGAMTGTSVSFYTEGATSVTGSGSVNISAPTTGPQNGILFFQSRSDSSTMAITGSGSMRLNGIVYAPAAQLNFTGSGSGMMNTDLVVKSLSLTGSGSFSNYATLNPSSPLTSVVMVE